MDAPLIIERIEIRKYDGDLPKPGEDKAPVEIVILDRREETPCLSPDSDSAR